MTVRPGTDPEPHEDIVTWLTSELVLNRPPKPAAKPRVEKAA